MWCVRILCSLTIVTALIQIKVCSRHLYQVLPSPGRVKLMASTVKYTFQGWLRHISSRALPFLWLSIAWCFEKLVQRMFISQQSREGSVMAHSLATSIHNILYVVIVMYRIYVCWTTRRSKLLGLMFKLCLKSMWCCIGLHYIGFCACYFVPAPQVLCLHYKCN